MRGRASKKKPQFPDQTLPTFPSAAHTATGHSQVGSVNWPKSRLGFCLYAATSATKCWLYIQRALEEEWRGTRDLKRSRCSKTSAGLMRVAYISFWITTGLPRDASYCGQLNIWHIILHKVFGTALSVSYLDWFGYLAMQGTFGADPVAATGIQIDSIKLGNLAAALLGAFINVIRDDLRHVSWNGGRGGRSTKRLVLCSALLCVCVS